MTIGSIPPISEAVSNEPAVRQSAAGGDSAFSSTFMSRATLSSGSADLDSIFEAAGQKYNISPNLLKAVAQVESNFRPHVTSRAGAMGIMQLMPGTAAGLGVTDPFDPEQNIMGGANYLRQQLDRFDGDVELALAAYNAGWPAVKRHGGIPPFRETQNYVPKVLEIFGGGDITAGPAATRRITLPASAEAPGGAEAAGGAEASGGAEEEATQREGSLAAFNEVMTQMVMMKMIEMQMNSSNDDDNRNKIPF